MYTPFLCRTHTSIHPAKTKTKMNTGIFSIYCKFVTDTFPEYGCPLMSTSKTKTEQCMSHVLRNVLNAYIVVVSV